MRSSAFRALSVGGFGASISLVFVLSLYGHTCYMNKTSVDCSTNQQNQYNTCVNCTVIGYLCSQNVGKFYTDATDIYTYTTVQVGQGTVKKVGDQTVAKCWDEYQCTNSQKTDWRCLAGGCTDQNAQGTYCNECGQGALIPNRGSYNVFPTEDCVGS